MASRIAPVVPGVRRREDHAGVVAEGHDRHGVALAQAVDQPMEGVLDRLEPRLALHRAGGVDDERQGRVIAGPVAHVASTQADAQDDLVGIGERRRAAVDVDGEGVVLGRGVVVLEGVDPLLDAHAGRIRTVSVGDVALGDAVRGRVDVEREGRHPVLVGVDVRVDPRVVVGHPVERRPGWLWLPWLGGRRVVLGVRWPGGAAGSGGRGGPSTGHDDEGDARQGEVRLAHGATSLPEAAGAPPGRLGEAGAWRASQVPERSPPVRRRATALDAGGRPAVPGRVGRSATSARGVPGPSGSVGRAATVPGA